MFDERATAPPRPMLAVGVTYDHARNYLVCESCGTAWTFKGKGTPTRCPVCVQMPPLAGHAGFCAKVTHATVSGETESADWPCTCDCGDRA